MTLELVTVEEARAQLRLDADSAGGPDDVWLDIFIPAISNAVALWLKDSWRLYVPELDSAGEIVTDSSGDPVPSEDSSGPILQPAVRAAVLVELASQYRFREGEGDNRVDPSEGHGYALSKTATALLTGLRRSTVS